MINETLNSVGSWSLRLSLDTPFEVVDKIKHFGHIVILPQEVEHRLLGDVTYTSGTAEAMLVMARYVGIVKLRSPGLGGIELGGPGVLAWLGDSGIGYIYETQREYNAVGLATVLGSSSATPKGLLWTDTGGPLPVKYSTLYSTTGPSTYTGKHYLQTPRQALAAVMAHAGLEFRIYYGVSPDETVFGPAVIEFGDEADLYQTTPTAMAVRQGGYGSTVRGLPVSNLTSREQADQYVTKVVLARGGGSFYSGNIGVATASGSPSTSEPLETKDLAGVTLKRVGVVNDPAATADNAQGLADKALAELNALKAQVELSLRYYDVLGDFVVGDTIYVYDPFLGIYDLNNQEYFHGELTYPKAIRVQSLTWPVGPGLGVYYRDGDGNYTDLSPYVVRESSDTTIKVGASTPTLSTAQGTAISASVLSTRTSVNANSLSTEGNVGTKVRTSVNRTISNATNSPVTWNVEDEDDDTWHNNVTNPERVTVSPAGWYVLSVNVQWAGNGTGVRRLYFRQNGTDIHRVQVAPPNANAFQMQATTITKAADGDYFEVYAYQNSGGDLDIVASTTNTHFQVARLF